MKRNIYILITLSLFSLHLASQVSVNTEVLKGAFYIDALGNNTEEGSVIVSNSGNVGIGTTTPSEKLDVNGNILIVGNDSILGNAIQTNNIIGLDTLRFGNSNKLKDLTNLTSRLELVSNDIGKAFRFDNGTQSKNNIPNLKEMIPVLTKNSDTGIVEWQNLPSVTEIEIGELRNLMPIATTASSNHPFVNITSPNGSITLNKGLWLILAATSTDNGGNGNFDSTQGYYVYIGLVDNKTNTVIAQVGYPTEFGGSAAGYGVSTPQLMYPLYVDADNSSYSIALATSAGEATRAPKYQTNTAYMGGSSYFYAIKLDYIN